MSALSLLHRAVADRDPPFGVIDLDAVTGNLADLQRRAGTTPIRVASKSLRVRRLLTHALERPGYRGVLAFTLPEALWLHENGGPAESNLVVGYPTVHRAALAQLARSESAAAAITVMIDDLAQLDLIDQVVPAAQRPTIRVCLGLDAAFRPTRRVTLGALRSPIREPAELRALAEQASRRAGFRVVGVMAYEGQIAGVADGGRSVRQLGVRAMRRRSAAELAERRAAAVAAVRQVAELEFVNGGGTGSLESTTAEAAITEVAAGSGILGPALFDGYRSFSPRPGAFFVLPVVRRPNEATATILGGGWIASGPPGKDRLPTVHGRALRYVGIEGAGEVQTPLRGRAAEMPAIGDQIWLRHAKAGELAEHLNSYLVVSGGTVIDEWSTYRGEGKAFL